MRMPKMGVIHFYHQDVEKMSSSGIVFKRQLYSERIDFDECCRNYAMEHGIERSLCVAERDSIKLMFYFYSNPHVIIDFNKYKIFTNVFSRKAYRKFCELQKRICEFGYTTYDLT